MIRQFPQFINWHIVVEQTTKGTVERKVPFDPTTGRPIDPHLPQNWKSFEAAQATGQPVGFVLTANDPFFFLDLDKCRTTDGWTPEATAIFQQFPGAAHEVSHSGNGLHIMGMCNKFLTSDRKNKFGKSPGRGNWLEFYTDKRFVAFGPYGWHGDFRIDCTPAILRIVPRREGPEDDGNLTALEDQAHPDYTGPADDDELITKMLHSRGSIGAAFGDKASVEHLWYALVDVLSQQYPSPKDDLFDRSSADAALMMHLAFWTGKNPARMDRLFRRSGLMRAKYGEREDYRLATISGAVSRCTKVYNVAKSAPDLPQSVSLSEFLTINEQVEYFKGCIYIREQHAVLVPSGEIMSPAQFNVFYGGHTFQMSPENTTPTKKAFEAFTENRGFQFPKVHGTCFRPKATPHVIIDGKVNVYQPFHPYRIAGDATPFLQHIARMLPVEDDRAKLLAYMASLARNPGVKFQWAPVIQGVQGNGKTIITECMEYVVGEKYTHRPAAEDLTNSFNAYLDNKLLIAVEEIHTEGRREVLDVLKPLITNNRVETQPKGVDKRMVDNYTNWLFLTNHHDAVPKTHEDRRYAIFFTAQQDKNGLIRDGMGGDYFPRLYHWLREEGGKAIVADFLLSYAIPIELDPAGAMHRAPDTSTTEWAIRATMAKPEVEIREAIDAQDDGFRNGWISSYKLDVLFKEKGIRLGRYKINQLLESLGYKFIGRANKIVFNEEGKRPSLYVRLDLYNPMLTVDDYCAAQGYATQFRPMLVRS